MVCFHCFLFNNSIYCINCTVQQSGHANYVLCIESFLFSSNELFKQLLMDAVLCLTLELMGEQKIMDLGALM